MQPQDLVVAVALGVLQGLTEFLPISSSGHLSVFAMFFRIPDMSLTLLILLHAGTLLATLALFGGDLARLAKHCTLGLARPRQLLSTQEGALVLGLMISTATTGAIAVAIRDWVEAWADVPWWVGMCFLGSAAAVASTRGRTGSRQVPTLGVAILVGAVQALAALPGLSRSGLTMACAMGLGMSAPAAFRYSFLLSIPVVAGATWLELAKPGAMNHLTAGATVAAGVAFASGYAALRWLRRITTGGYFWRFAWYLVPLGSGMILLDLFGYLGRWQ